MIPYENIKRAALANARHLLPAWFPAGRIVGREFVVGNLRGDSGQSLSINLITGVWKDFATAASGSNLVELRAQARHGSDFDAAAIEVGRDLGVYLNGHASNAAPKVDDTQHRHKPADDWQPMVPPPPGVAPPDNSLLRRFDVVYEYTTLDDRVSHYVGRIEARGGRRKKFVPITYGRRNGILGWHFKHPASPRPLYGLNRLAALPDALVLLCEGEKAADAAQAIFPDHVCISWYGGTGSVDCADTAPLHGRCVIIWPDNDVAGHKAAEKLAARPPGARILDVSDLPDGADAADIHPEDPDAWLADRLLPVASVEPPPPEGEGDYGDTGTAEPPVESDTEGDDAPNTELADALSVISWANLDIPPETKLLGDFITSSSRVFLVGSTGLGKTLFAYGLVGGMAGRGGFLHWKGDRPSKWLIIDGEMPRSLVKARSIDMIRRAGGHALPPHNALIYSRDRAEEFARLFPDLGELEPLNTEGGHAFVMRLINAIGGIDGVVFDNVMSLAPGDQKDEEVWAGCIPLVEQISRAGIAQVWCDHTGHNTGRQYGTNTKSWRFDASGIMTPLSETEQPIDHTAFKLSFDSPGKARRRTPDNWQDFETRIIRLIDDEWTSEPVKAAMKAGTRAGPEAPLADKPALMLAEIRAALKAHGRYQEVEKGAPAVLSASRQTVRERLIKGGWFPESMLSGAFTLARSAYTTETNELRKLKRKDFIDFNRDFVWQR